MRTRTLAAVLCVLALAACGGTDTSEEAPQGTTAPKATTAPKPTQESRPGDPAVYARIAKMTDCDKLQEQFDLAEQTSQWEGDHRVQHGQESGFRICKRPMIG